MYFISFSRFHYFLFYTIKLFEKFYRLWDIRSYRNTNINTNKGGVSGYTYHVSGIKYYGTSGYSKKFNVGEKYHLIYSIKDPKYSIIIWDIPINAELNREDVNIEAYIGIGKQRISKGIIDYDL